MFPSASLGTGTYHTGIGNLPVPVSNHNDTIIIIIVIQIYMALSHADACPKTPHIEIKYT